LQGGHAGRHLHDQSGGFGKDVGGDAHHPRSVSESSLLMNHLVILSCELSKAAGEVRWFKDGNEIFLSKNVLVQSDGRKRWLVIRKATKANMGLYTCDCGTDKTTADLNIEGKPAAIGTLLSPSEPEPEPEPPLSVPPLSSQDTRSPSGWATVIYCMFHGQHVHVPPEPSGFCERFPEMESGNSHV
uniref:Ig-like domain-containing protein n=1 Tax=Amphiprion percula TaxID=161767 RepID=A0A3P8ST04_AMPPE